MTSVIVRSSTNIYAGAKTRFSCFFHGLFLLVCVVFLSSLLNRIPLSALAAVLVVIGYKLSSITIFKRVFSMGIDQFIPFLVTLMTTIFSDLLTGVIVGLVVAFAILLKTSVYGAIVAVQDGTSYYIQFIKDVSFSNKAYLRKILQQIPPDSTVFIDGTRAMFVDHDIYEMLYDFTEKAGERNIDVELIEVRGKSYHLVTRKRKKIHEEIPQPTTAVK